MVEITTHRQAMSRSALTFENSIEDANYLLTHFDSVKATVKNPDSLEVVKRAGLVMALTAWETYIEDRIRESVDAQLRVLNGSRIGSFMDRRLTLELKQLHNPSSEKVKRLFVEFLDVDVTEGWRWSNHDPASARKMLDGLIIKRGEVVHRSKAPTDGPPNPHLVKRDELDKAITFLKGLVAATEKALEAF